MNLYFDHYNSFLFLYFLGLLIYCYNIYHDYLQLIRDHENFLNDRVSETFKSINEKDEKDKNNQPEIPYEKKYLDQVRKLSNEYVFSLEELEKEQKILLGLIENKKKSNNDEIILINKQMDELKNQCKDEILTKALHNEMEILKTKLVQLESMIDEEELKKKARQFIIDEQLKKYKKNFIIENTPLGNVLMFYNHQKLTFDYYSDVTIPYRFLETVARKYVIIYKYRPLYIDMEEELKNFEHKLEQIEKEKEVKENEKNMDNQSNNEYDLDQDKKKKNVFAKFKTYNKEAGTGKVNMAPPPKNSIPLNMVNVNLKGSKMEKDGKNEKILLKERSNRYSHQGKMANFSILQKIDRKKVDKKFALSFADFKKLQNNNQVL